MSQWKSTHSATGAQEVDISGGDFTCRAVTRRLYVGTAGDVAVEYVNGDQVTYKAGQGYHDICIVKVLQSGSSAADMVVEY